MEALAMDMMAALLIGGAGVSAVAGFIATVLR